MKSKYRMGWLFVCFDLPVVDDEERRQANVFRKDLLKQGYFMLQNSIYVRSCVAYDRTEQYIKLIQRLAPDTGQINIFYLTDKQWTNSICIEKANSICYKLESFGKSELKKYTTIVKRFLDNEVLINTFIKNNIQTIKSLFISSISDIVYYKIITANRFTYVDNSLVSSLTVLLKLFHPFKKSE